MVLLRRDRREVAVGAGRPRKRRGHSEGQGVLVAVDEVGIGQVLGSPQGWPVDRVWAWKRRVRATARRVEVLLPEVGSTWSHLWLRSKVPQHL